MCMHNYSVQRFFHDAGVLAVTQLCAGGVHCILTPDCRQVLRVTFYINYTCPILFLYAFVLHW